VTTLSYRAFYGCNKFTNITLVGYNGNPNWGSYPKEIFINWNNNSSSTVSSINGTLTSTDALAFLQQTVGMTAPSLPNNWTAASETL
jgi:hypothetical protein